MRPTRAQARALIAIRDGVPLAAASPVYRMLREMQSRCWVATTDQATLKLTPKGAEVLRNYLARYVVQLELPGVAP